MLKEPTSLKGGERLMSGSTGEVGGVEGDGDGEGRWCGEVVVVEEESEIQP